jgi:hypothetical protein
MVLAAIVITGILLGVADVQTSHAIKREREEELLYRGLAYRAAIRSYYEAGTPVKSFPRELQDLLKDSRSVHKRHIRALYPDPMAHGKGEWKVVRGADGGISGVASTSKDTPLKTANFPSGLEKFDAAKTYEEWVFEYAPARTAPAGRVPPPAPAAGTSAPPS